MINSSEWRNNMNKYLNLAVTDPVVIQRGNTEILVLSKQERIVCKMNNK
jgi:hypothetical protein